jgi:hypothetical protein
MVDEQYIKLCEDVSELRTDIKYLIKTVDGITEDRKVSALKVDAMCETCEPAKSIAAHIAEGKEHKVWTWDRIVFGTTSVLTLISILVVLMLGIININIDKHNPRGVTQTSQFK